MNYEMFNMGSYNLHLIKTTKFKSITVEVFFRRKIDSKEITMRNLLKILLLNSTNNYPSERQLIKRSEELFDLKLFSEINRIGNYSELAFKVRFLNEKYTKKKLNRESILYLLDIIFNPNAKNNMFNKSELDLCKERLKKVILSEKDDKSKYSLRKLLETTKNKAYSYNPYGDIKDLDKIDEKNLYKYYKSIIDKDLVDIFVVGDISSYEVKEIFRKYFKIDTFKKGTDDLIVKELNIKNRINKVKIVENANQTIFTLLCSLNKLTDFERKYVIKVYNEILGGFSSSLLFETIREKKSYAYFVNSVVMAYDNVLLIYSGIKNENTEEVLKLVKKSLINISKGKFSKDIFESAKERVISSLKSVTDSPNAIINTYYSMILVNNDNIEQRIKNFSKVTITDVINVAKKVTPYTMLVLEGSDYHEDNKDK